MELRRRLGLLLNRAGLALQSQGRKLTPITLRPRPPTDAVAEITRIRDEIEAGGDAVFLALRRLSDSDHLMIGHVVQIMNFVDFNARRALEILDRCHPDGRITPEPRDSGLLRALSRRLEGSPVPDAERIECQQRLEVLRGFQPIRNHLAHWVARRAPTADALVLATKNAREGSRRAGFGPDQFGVIFAVMPVLELRLNLPIMIRHHEWLAAHVSFWFRRYVDPAG